jgi:hypothetical protein
MLMVPNLILFIFNVDGSKSCFYSFLMLMVPNPVSIHFNVDGLDLIFIHFNVYPSLRLCLGRSING